MADGTYDVAVLGSAPLALLLAGLLASLHGKRVVLVAAPASPFRPVRGYDLAVAPMTRPETWALLRRTTPETLKLIAGFGKAMFVRIDPLFSAGTSTGREALGYIRHVAADFGYAVERQGSGLAQSCRFRDVPLLQRARLAEGASPWLDRSEVLRVAPVDAQVSLKRDGSARIEVGRLALEAAQTILADDDAILDHLRPDEPDWMRLETTTSVLTEPTSTLGAPLIHHIDSGLVLLQRPTGAIAALASGPDAQQRIGAALGARGQLRLAGQSSFPTIATADGAPVAGAAKATRATVLAGFGPIGGFLAPAIARVIAGAAPDDELGYFVARDAGKARGAVADYAAPAAVAAL